MTACKVLALVRRIVVGLLLVWASLASAGAHSMDQVKAEFRAGAEGRAWTARIWIEAWAAYPEDGPKVPPGTPGDPATAGKAWMDTLGPVDHEKMREILDWFMHETFVLTLDGARLDFTTAFPDFDQEPPEFEENAEENSLIRVDLDGAFPPGAAGPVELVWNDDEDEPLAIDVITPREGKPPRRLVLRISPRDEPIELLKVEAGGELTESSEVSVWTWIVAGFHHILPLGLDHILFILGLFFLQPKLRPLLSQSLAFTVAHSITLALVVLGVFSISSRFVESMIALSIAYVGVENLWVKELKPWRVAFVFGLGLLHGMGFASVMRELDIPEGSIVEPLVGFNLGVEAGQVTVLLLAFGGWAILYQALKFARRRQLEAAGAASSERFIQRPMKWVAKAASAAIALTGLYWTIERAFF